MERARVLFVYANPLRIPYVDLGIASLSAYLRAHGCETALIDFTFRRRRGAAVTALRRFEPDLVCFTSRSGEFPEVVRLARYFRGRHSAPQVCGGIHPSVAPEGAIAHDCFDGIGLGEGEAALLSLARSVKQGRTFHDTPGFWFRDRDRVIRNPRPPLIDDLDTLPPLDYERFEMATYLKMRHGQADYVSARGCPFTCSYCANAYLIAQSAGLGRYARWKSAESMLAETASLRERWPAVRSLKIADEHFILDRSRLKILAARYPAEVGLPFECDVRADFCDEESMRLLKEMGCAKLNIAIESGDEQLRFQVLNKRIRDEAIAEAFALARRFGIHTMSFNMIGLPRETEAQVFKTIALNRRVEPDSIQATVFTPYEGTPLRAFCLEHGLLETETIAPSYYDGYYLKNSELTPRRLRTLQRRFAYYCYRDRSRFKAWILLLRDHAIPVYLRLRGWLPPFALRGIYALLWGVRAFRFASK